MILVSSKEVLGIVVLMAILTAPVSAQVATQSDIEVLERKIIDLDSRVRALEWEKQTKRQAEQQTYREREAAAELENWRNCQAYRQRIAADPHSTRGEITDKLDKMDCVHADEFEARMRVTDPKKR